MEPEAITFADRATAVRDPAVLAARRSAAGRTYRVAALIGLFVFVVLNANGREIPASDSQAAKYASVALARRGALTLDGLVGRVPQYGERLAFQRDREGHWRNAYPLPPVLEGAAVAAILKGLGLVQLDARLAPALVAKLTASALVSLASAIAFVIAVRFCRRGPAALVAVGFALASGLWPTASQTLWQHATVVWSVALAVCLWVSRADRDGRIPYHLAAGLLLGWAASARPQTLPMLLILSAGILWRSPAPRRIAFAIAFLLPLTVFAGLNVRWFGDPFGSLHAFEAASLAAHRVESTWQFPLAGAVGLLVSPSRGLLVFSPIVLIVLGARPRDPAERTVLRVTIAAAAVQLIVYASFSVWWGGHTYGPRYILDGLPLLIPAAALGVARIGRAPHLVAAGAVAALLWSIATGATGAFCYPHDGWNTDPASVDHFHERLWDVRDSQIPRCWARGPSPQNFALFTRDAWRRN
ncbi:MAG TPA: hypothetical protein VFK57_23250 [Vicinamibacterales bacterium]|nr:hypothetical protein [Vicinamibacterales bacterium]